MLNKIIIFGFPHSGTTILRKIFSQTQNVSIVGHESLTAPDPKGSYDYMCTKWPYYSDNFFTEKYSKYLKIFIMRNPVYIFSSINRRKNYPKHHHDIDTWASVAQKFLNLRQKPIKNCECILYKEIFNDDYVNLKSIFDKYEIRYTNDTFVTQTNSHSKRPCPTDHDNFRSWQINQKFENKNFEHKVQLTERQKTKITNLQTYKKLFKEQ